MAVSGRASTPVHPVKYAEKLIGPLLCLFFGHAIQALLSVQGLRDDLHRRTRTAITPSEGPMTGAPRKKHKIMMVNTVIVAAGRGTRANVAPSGPDRPDAGVLPVAKQYALIDGRAVLAHAIDVFAAHPKIGKILIVIHKDDHGAYEEMCVRDGFAGTLLEPVIGGATRQESVRRGLEHLATVAEETTHVLIHDAARPFVTAGVLDRVIRQLTEGTGALAALPVVDSLQRTDDNGALIDALPRQNVWRAQTPQGFAFQEILTAHQEALRVSNTDFTDDASLFQWAGGRVIAVMGAKANSKITTAEDLRMAQTSKHADGSVQLIRTGTGYDVHKTGPGTSVMLCGVKVPADFSLVGHSDADVALHALTDAIFGALGDGDIGSHFPPTDPKWKGAASELFLAHAAQSVRERGGRINNVDVTIICEHPRIGPVRDDMRQELARILELALDRVSVKATTSEGLGFTGRGEGIAVMASATLTLP